MENFEETVVNPNIYRQHDEVFRQYKPVKDEVPVFSESSSSTGSVSTFVFGAVVAVVIAAIAVISQY